MPEEPVLQLDHAEVGTDVRAPGLVAHGEVHVNGAVVRDQVNLDDAELTAPGQTALHAEVRSSTSARRTPSRRAAGTSGCRTC
ncbi:hypothetical protein [Streptomyces olivaceoviridis]|uniref:hypothetical protein n=1 Tax=Streptomyces olivaceoviridis TaxID=1921 RepID=UPI0036C8EDEC